MSDIELRTVDLFAGAGGLSLGLHLADRGFTPVLAVEIDGAAARTFKRNFGCQVIDEPIETVEVFPDADVIVGGPPCQGFSPLGRDRDDDSRAELNALWMQYLRAIRQIRPLAFVVENVPQFLASEQFRAFREELGADSEHGEYRLSSGVLNAADYGVAQLRRRGIVLGIRRDRLPAGWGWPPFPPMPTYGPQAGNAAPYRTVRDVIGDLPLKPTGEDLHWPRNPEPRSIERYRAVPEGGNRFDLTENRPDLLPDCWRRKKTGTTDVFGRLWWNRPASTIRTEFFKPEKGRFLHPSEDRPITHREAARLQSFPDTFEFEGSKIEIARQIGNAVPPLLGAAIAGHVADLLAV